MNFLAHALLSPANDQMLVGNFFGDSFKGRPEKHGPKAVVEGIVLHRKIDHYTDSHFLVLEAVNLFREQQKRFAPVVIDLVFDHLLAVNFEQWSPDSLESFSTSVFGRLDDNEQHIPALAQRFYPHMRKHNWLLHYKKQAGLELALKGMDRRSTIATAMVNSVGLVEKHRNELNALFGAFFPDLINFVNDHLESIKSDIGSRRVPLK